MPMPDGAVAPSGTFLSARVVVSKVGVGINIRDGVCNLVPLGGDKTSDGHDYEPRLGV